MSHVVVCMHRRIKSVCSCTDSAVRRVHIGENINNELASREEFLSLERLGINDFFSRQTVNATDDEEYALARVIAMSRRTLTLSDGRAEFELLRKKSIDKDPEQGFAVGDWVLMTQDRNKIDSVLERSSLLKRAVRNRRQGQLLAANVDVCFLVTSCNDDFNESRLERYLALTDSAGAQAHIVLTKIDLHSNPRTFGTRARVIASDAPITFVNARDRSTLTEIAQALQPNLTGVFIGSSGVGKSTIVNSLLGYTALKTASVRRGDRRGRHTTTARSLHVLPNGGCVIDVPGLKLLATTDAAESVASTFADIEMLASKCRFSDCNHDTEPDCAVMEAVKDGVLTERRVQNYRLMRIAWGQQPSRAQQNTMTRNERLKRNERLARDIESDED